MASIAGHRHHGFTDLGGVTTLTCINQIPLCHSPHTRLMHAQQKIQRPKFNNHLGKFLVNYHALNIVSANFDEVYHENLFNSYINHVVALISALLSGAKIAKAVL